MRVNLNHSKLKKYIYTYNKFGFVRIPKVFDMIDTNNIKNSLEEFIDSNKNKLKGRELNFASSSKKINSIHNLKKCKIVKQLKSNKEIIFIAEKFVGEKPKEFGAELFAKPKKIGMAAPVHQDNYYWNISKDNGITIRIALDKSTKKNGSLYYFSGSHKIGIQQHKASNVAGTSQTIKNLDILKFFKKKLSLLHPGDIVIHHSSVIHGSGHNKSNIRRMALNLRFIPKKSKINYYLKKNYEKDLKKK